MPLHYADIKQFKKTVIIYNYNSGKQIFTSMMPKINELFKRVKNVVGTHNAEMWHILRFDQLPELADRIVKEQVDWVIIAGGDGTIRAMIEQLVDRDYRPYFSVFPAGTVNLIARELHLSSEPAKWMKRVSKGINSPVYLGRTNGNVFLTVTSIGFDSLVVDNVTEKEKKLLSKFAYVLQGTELIRKKVLLNKWNYRFEVRFDDEDKWYDAATVIVGKSRYYAGRYSLFNGAALSSDTLHVALFTGSSNVDFARYAACVAMETLSVDRSIIVKTAHKLEIRCNVENFAAELDGDAITTAPLKIFVEPVPLKFLA